MLEVNNNVESDLMAKEGPETKGFIEDAIVHSKTIEFGNTEGVSEKGGRSEFGHIR